MGMTPLMVAAVCGRHRNVEIILKAAVKNQNMQNIIERPDRSNYAAVHYAAQFGHTVIFSSLFQWAGIYDI